MGGAMLRGWISSGYDTNKITLIDPMLSDEMAELGVKHYKSADEWKGEIPDFIILAVKPPLVQEALSQVDGIVNEENVILSVSAGKRICDLEAPFENKKVKVIRAMPNTPAQVARAISVCVDNGRVSEEQKNEVTELLSCIGVVEWIEDEAMMDAVTGVSGSGPAYIFYMAEVLAKAAEDVGLPKELAMKLAIHTINGAGELLLQADVSAGQLRQNVTSPKGTTEKALEVLMNQESGLQVLMKKAVEAATERSKELGEDK